MSLIQSLKDHRGLVVMVTVGLLGWGGYRGLVNWQQGQLVRQARAFLQKGDYRSAALSARQALQINVANLEACRIIAEMAELAGSTDAIYWRRRIVELEPSVSANRLEWARTALRFGEAETADRALLSIDAAGRETAAYHAVTAGLALTLKQPRLAESHFAEAVKRDPSNARYHLDLANVRLLSPDPKRLGEARKTLVQLLDDPSLRASALRSLLADAVRADDEGKALPLARHLAADPNAQFEDWLLCLDVLRRAKHADFPTGLRQLQGQAVQNPANLYQLVSWMNVHGMAEEAREWTRSLSKGMQAEPLVRMALANCLAGLKDWAGVQALVEPGDWGNLNFIRLAILTRALRENGSGVAWRIQWRAAVTAASADPRALRLLARLVKGWQWKSECEELLWTMARGGSGPKWALQQLYQQYRADGNTRGLRRVLSRALELDPADLVARNNLAHLGLLLGVMPGTAFEEAQKLYRKDPTNPAFASTYAFALHCQNRTAEGLKVLAALSENHQRIPAVAAYYAILLAANGETERARKYLDRSSPAALLPEEQALLAQARKGLKTQ